MITQSASHRLELPAIASVHITGPDEQSIADFEQLLRFVWAKVDPQDREGIREYWKNAKMDVFFHLECPWFGEDWSWAKTAQQGLHLRMQGRIWQLFPAEVRSTILAHELAHVYQWSVGKHRFALTCDDIQDTGGDIMVDLLDEEGKVEVHADQTMARWGFDPIDAFRWVNQFLEFENGTPVMRDQPLTRAYAQEKG